MTDRIDWAQAPDDPVDLLLWVRDVLNPEIEGRKADAYFLARLQGEIDLALAVGLDPKKAVMRMTRSENERRGRVVRWNGL